MTYTPPQGNLISINFDGVDYIAPQGNLVALDFSITPVVGDDKQYLFPNTINSLIVGSPVLAVGQFVKPLSINELKIGTAYAWRFNQHINTSGINSNAFGLGKIENLSKELKPTGVQSKATFGTAKVYNLTTVVKPSGWQSSSVGASAQIINRNKYLSLSGFVATGVGSASVINLAAILKPTSWRSSSVATGANVSNINKALYPSSFKSSEVGTPESVLNKDREFALKGFNAALYGDHTIYNATLKTGATGWLSLSISNSLSVANRDRFAVSQGFEVMAIGKPSIVNKTNDAFAKGWQSSTVGAGVSIVNNNKNLSPSSWVSSSAGKPLVYNLAQYQRLNGFDTSRYGTPYLMGGLKYVRPSGINSNANGQPILVNTTADQTARPSGINSLSIQAPTVSPRITYPSGINSLKFGNPNVRDPSIKPLGDEYSDYGKPTIWFHTRPLAPNGILGFESGYLRIADPTQFVLAPSLIESAIFGDTAIKNTSTRITIDGINELSFSDYSTLTNSNRYYQIKGIDSASIGLAAIKNKTPSIFVGGITHYDIGLPAIGHAIRYTQPEGFDHLSFGQAVLTKTPELFPRGHQSSVVGQSWISHKNRDIELSQKGIDSFKAGTQIVWYGQRSVKTKGWQTADYGKPVLTHEVRELIAQGFKRDAYGTHWISQGTRAIEPQGIYKDFPSNHMLGGTQTIKPAGYEATLWGERIIPISQSLQPLGFIGSWGDALVDLKTKYIAPVGYISVGQQPADRWGGAAAYNKLQYIVQDYDVDSGLVPPKWSDYLLVANRNIQMNVTSFVSQKFGYSQIDNNATPLLPVAIEPPVITIGMISHGVRSIAPEAIEAPPILDWNVLHNDARVIAPLGRTQTLFGNEGAVANTRRYYSGIGRFESLETGTPMIAYRVRTIDIEPRYSIAPPQINLPTVDLYTRYVGFNGYETVKYGLPSLSIHFNIIGPRWNHRDDFGYGAVKNVTPELQVGAFDSQDFGKASIRTQWRHVLAQGDTATLFGSLKIADRKQTVKPLSWQDVSVSQKHTVIKTGTPPYVTQNIWLQNESNPRQDGYGIEPSSKPSSPGLNQNVLYHRGHNSQRFGDAFVYSNNLYIEIGISTKNIAKGPTVTNRVRIISIDGINNEITVSDKAKVSPYYIKPKSFNYPRDFQTFDDDKFGTTRVTNQNRTIYPASYSTSSRVGLGSKAYLKDRYIEPPTIRSFAMGFPEIPFTLKTIDAKDYGFNSARHGSTSVSRPPYTGPQTINAKGFNSLNINTQKIELFNRELQASGSNSLRMGASKSNDTPYMWQGLRIGEFVPMSIGAGDTSLFGKTVIGLRVREISVEGFVAFRSEYEPIKFKDRMKVIGTITDNVKSQGVVVGGISSQAMGSTGVKLGQYFIRPDGNSDQFRKSSYSAEFGAPTISG